MSQQSRVGVPSVRLRRAGLLTILKGVGLSFCGLIGLGISLEWFAFRLASKVNMIFGAGLLFGFGMIGLGVFRTVFEDRMPRVAMGTAVVSAIVGLGISFAVLELVLTESPW
ncbi:MAG: hypothetical protein AB8G99_09905 [Planctomycetaceae bacterium]